MAEEVCVPFVVDDSVSECAAWGLNAFADKESEWLVSGVRPFASDEALF